VAHPNVVLFDVRVGELSLGWEANGRLTPAIRLICANGVPHPFTRSLRKGWAVDGSTIHPMARATQANQPTTLAGQIPHSSR
jgi:hypothetical protein